MGSSARVAAIAFVMQKVNRIRFFITFKFQLMVSLEAREGSVKKFEVAPILRHLPISDYAGFCQDNRFISGAFTDVFSSARTTGNGCGYETSEPVGL